MVAIAFDPKPAVRRGEHEPAGAACPVCGARLMDIRGQLHCTRCHALCEGACEGGRHVEADG